MLISHFKKILVDQALTAITDLNSKKLPLGTIIAWISKVGDSTNNSFIPDGWLKCNGSEIPSPSIWAGKMLPNLNTDKRQSC